MHPVSGALLGRLSRPTSRNSYASLPGALGLAGRYATAMQRLLPLALILFVVVGCRSTAGSTDDPRPGTLVVVGGGGTPPAVLARALQLAGEGDVSVAVIPFASGREDRGDGAVQMWLEAGASSAVNIEDDPATAGDVIETADIVWMIGGDQNRLVEWLGTSGMLPAFQRRWSTGGIFGGTSAGAAVMTERMLTGEADLESLRAATTVTAPGFNLWADVIVDQHFVARRRNNRLLSAVLDGPHEIGIGIDERTAVIVHPGNRCEVLGEGSVVIYDARRASIAEVQPGELWSARSIVLHVLRDGDTFRVD